MKRRACDTFPIGQWRPDGAVYHLQDVSLLTDTLIHDGAVYHLQDVSLLTDTLMPDGAVYHMQDVSLLTDTRWSGVSPARCIIIN